MNAAYPYMALLSCKFICLYFTLIVSRVSVQIAKADVASLPDYLRSNLRSDFHYVTISDDNAVLVYGNRSNAASTSGNSNKETMLPRIGTSAQPSGDQQQQQRDGSKETPAKLLLEIKLHAQTVVEIAVPTRTFITGGIPGGGKVPPEPVVKVKIPATGSVMIDEFSTQEELQRHATPLHPVPRDEILRS